MNEIELVKVISLKLGRECKEIENIIDKKIGYKIDNKGNVIQLCMNDCNLMNETIPSELWQLGHLTILCLSTNMISNFPEEILNLKELKRLDLNGNQLRVITNKIKELPYLESLDLAGNQLETLPKSIGLVPSLKKLRLNSNRLISLPKLNPDIHWTKLESIDLDGADMKELPTWIFYLKSLKFLSLSKLHLNRFPALLSNLENLERLYIDSTQFPVWPDRINLPSSMRFIVLDGANLPRVSKIGIYKIPDAIIDLKPKYAQNQNSIDINDIRLQVSLGGNISIGLDENLLFHNDPSVSYNYLKNLYKDDKFTENKSMYSRLRDIKIVLLGSGAVGKTSLVQRLHLSNPDNDNIALESVETTHGVNLDYKLNLCDIWDSTSNDYYDFTIHFWDFGGQDKYRGINKLLLTDKAIYIIVLDSRAQSMPDVWLEMVKIYAPNSKVILVANKIDENPRLNINFKFYCEKYPQLYNCLFKVSCKYPSLGINKISDIVYAIKKIIEEQMNVIVPIGRVEWLNIQTELENQYHVHNKVVLSSDEYTGICEKFGISDESEQYRLLTILSNCGSCISIDDENVSILSPNWIADYLYLFHNNLEYYKALMNYKKEYIPMLNKLKEYSEHKELITDYLEQRGLCNVFYNDKHIKHIFIPLFLPEEYNGIDELPQDNALLKYKFESAIIPEYEFQKFLVREFSRISKYLQNAWQFGIYFCYLGAKIYMQLINDGITLEIWSNDVIVCGKVFQWIRNAILSTTESNFFNEYILVGNEEKSARLPYNTLEKLNSWNWNLYCLPDQDDLSYIVAFDVRIIAQKCGLRNKTFEDEIIDETLRFNKIYEHGGTVMQVQIEKMFGDIKNYETHGENSPIIFSDDNLNFMILQEIASIKKDIETSENDFEDLKLLLEEFERDNFENKTSIKNRLSNWLSQMANVITIGGALHGDKVIDGINKLLSLLS